MSRLAENSSQGLPVVENEVVRLRPLLTKQFIPKQDFPEPSTSTKKEETSVIFDVSEDDRDQTFNQPVTSQKEAVEIAKDVSENQTAVHFKRNLYNRDAITKKSKRSKPCKRNKKSIETVQPRSASVILNEFVKTDYYLDQIRNKNNVEWRATLHIDNIEYIGYGRSKVAAKNSAAEIVLKNIYCKMQQNANMNLVRIAIGQGVNCSNPLPWEQLITCYEIFKWLYSINNFNNWKQNQIQQQQNTVYYDQKLFQYLEKKDPVILITEAMQATFQEVSQGSIPRNVTFLFKCNVGQDSFFGTGPNKKLAKKMAAYEACNKLLGIKYPKSIYVSSR